jgi:hypothetical protein
LTAGRLPETASRIVRVIEPAVLCPTGASDLFSVVLPMEADYQ